MSSPILRYDTLYKKDVKSFKVDKGSKKELRHIIPYGSSVTIRVSSNNPVLMTLAGPHIEEHELVGTKEFKFTADPGTELFISFQGKTGFFAKSANVTLEVEMYTAREAVEISEEVSNLLDVLKELGKDYYDLNKEHVQDVLKRIVRVWKILENDAKRRAKELMLLAKKYGQTQ